MVRRKFTKKHQLPEEPVEAPAAAAPAEPSSPSSSPDEGPSTAPTTAPKKKYRPTHSEIKDYDFSEEQVQTLLDFLKDNPCLYDKKEKSYHNNMLKLDLWKKCAELFPGCSYLQVRKFFEKKRTAFGKIEAAEMKSGAEVRPRTAREQEIMRDWGFFRGHIAHAPTLSSQAFSAHEDSSSATDSSDLSGLSATSIQRRKNLKKRRLPESESNPEPAPAPASAAVPVHPGESFIERMFEKASAMIQHPPPSTSQSQLEVFSRFVLANLQYLSADEQDSCMMDILAILNKYKSRKRQQTAQQTQHEQQPPPFLHTQPQQQHQHYQPPQPPRPQAPVAWMQRPQTPPISYQQQPLTQPQYVAPSTSGPAPWAPPAASSYEPFRPPATFQQQQQYGPQQTFGSYSQAPSSSGAQTIPSPSKRTVSDLGSPLAHLMRDLDIPSPISSLNTPQKDPEEPGTSK